MIVGSARMKEPTLKNALFQNPMAQMSMQALSAMFAGHAVDEVIHHSEIVEQVLLQHYDKQTEEAIDSCGVL